MASTYTRSYTLRAIGMPMTLSTYSVTQLSYTQQPSSSSRRRRRRDARRRKNFRWLIPALWQLVADGIRTHPHPYPPYVPFRSFFLSSSSSSSSTTSLIFSHGYLFSCPSTVEISLIFPSALRCSLTHPIFCLLNIQSFSSTFFLFHPELDWLTGWLFRYCRGARSRTRARVRGVVVHPPTTNFFFFFRLCGLYIYIYTSLLWFISTLNGSMIIIQSVQLGRWRSRQQQQRHLSIMQSARATENRRKKERKKERKDVETP